MKSIESPFLGGGSIFVYFKQLYPSKSYWINDIYYELYKFWCLRIKLLSQLLNNTKISSLDYQEVIEKQGDNVFIFLDPPYFSAVKSALYGKNGSLHKIFNHERFADVMKKCNHKCLITYDDSNYAKELFSFASIFSWDMKYGMRNVKSESSQIGKELFISNYLYDLNKEERLMLFDKKIKTIL